MNQYIHRLYIWLLFYNPRDKNCETTLKKIMIYDYLVMMSDWLDGISTTFNAHYHILSGQTRSYCKNINLQRRFSIFFFLWRDKHALGIALYNFHYQIMQNSWKVGSTPEKFHFLPWKINWVHLNIAIMKCAHFAQVIVLYGATQPK